MHNSLVLGGSLFFQVFCLLPALHKLLCVTPNLLPTGVIVTGQEKKDIVFSRIIRHRLVARARSGFRDLDGGSGDGRPSDGGTASVGGSGDGALRGRGEWGIDPDPDRIGRGRGSGDVGREWERVG